MSREFKNYTIFNAKKAVGIGKVILVSDFRHKEIVVATAGLTAGHSIEVQVQGSFEIDQPDFSSAPSIDNLWDFVQCINHEDFSPIDGDTGIIFADSNDVGFFSLNVNGLRWISLKVSAINDPTSSVTAKILLSND